MGLWATWFSQHSPLLLLCLAASRLGPLAKMRPNCESANSWMPPWTSQKTADLMTNFQLYLIWSRVLTSKTYETPSSMPQKCKNDQTQNQEYLLLVVLLNTQTTQMQVPSSRHWNTPSNHQRIETCSGHVSWKWEVGFAVCVPGLKPFLAWCDLLVPKKITKMDVCPKVRDRNSTLPAWYCWSCHWWAWSPHPGSPPWFVKRSSAGRSGHKSWDWEVKKIYMYIYIYISNYLQVVALIFYFETHQSQELFHQQLQESRQVSDRSDRRIIHCKEVNLGGFGPGRIKWFKFLHFH